MALTLTEGSVNPKCTKVPNLGLRGSGIKKQPCLQHFSLASLDTFSWVLACVDHFLGASFPMCLIQDFIFS